jgi:alkaline phosphatase D
VPSCQTSGRRLTCADRGYMTVNVNYTHLETSWYAYPGNQQARVPNNRTLAMRATVEAGANQVQRPLMTPVFGAIKAN